MFTSARRFALAAVGAASLGFVPIAAPQTAMACDNNSPSDLTCPGINLNPANPTSPLNPANNPAFYASPSIPAAPDTYGQSYGMATGPDAVGLLSGIFGAGQPAPAVDPGEGYAPQDAPVIAHHRHHRRRVE